MEIIPGQLEEVRLVLADGRRRQGDIICANAKAKTCLYSFFSMLISHVAASILFGLLCTIINNVTVLVKGIVYSIIF